MKGSQPLLIEVEREGKSFLALVEHLPTRHNLLDGISIGTHGIVHLLHGGQHHIVELVDGFIELSFLEAVLIQSLAPIEERPRHRGSDAPSHTSMLAHILHIVRGIPERTVQKELRQPVEPRRTEQSRLGIDLPFCRPHIRPTEQQITGHTYPHRLHIVGQRTGGIQGLGHILRIKSQKYRQGIDVLNDTRLGHRDGSQRAIIHRLGLCHIEFRDQSCVVSHFGNLDYLLLRSRIPLEHIHLLLHLAEVEVSRCHLGTKAHHRGIVILPTCGIELLLRLGLLTDHPEHIELPTHLHRSIVIPRPSLRRARSQVPACLLTVPSPIEGERRIVFTLGDAPLRLRLIHTVDGH